MFQGVSVFISIHLFVFLSCSDFRGSITSHFGKVSPRSFPEIFRRRTKAEPDRAAEIEPLILLLDEAGSEGRDG